MDDCLKAGMKWSVLKTNALHRGWGVSIIKKQGGWRRGEGKAGRVPEWGELAG